MPRSVWALMADKLHKLHAFAVHILLSMDNVPHPPLPLMRVHVLSLPFPAAV